MLTPAADLLAGAAAAAASALSWEPPAPEVIESMTPTPGAGLASHEATPARPLTPVSGPSLTADDDLMGWGDDAPAESQPADDGWSAAADRPTEVGPESASGHGTGERTAAPSAFPPSARELTLDELLGQAVPQRDEMAAGALASATLALQGDPALSGQLEAAAAEDPLALDRVLRPSPQSVAALRQGASFSFDQFFQPAPAAEAAAPAAAGTQGQAATATAGRASEASPVSAGEGAAPGGVDADASAREADLAEFHAWLAGLSET